MLEQGIKEFMVQTRFVQSNGDPCVYTRFEDHAIIVAVYVDDLILLADVIEDLIDLKSLLSECFKMKDMGQLHYYLGVNVVYGKIVFGCIKINTLNQSSESLVLRMQNRCLPQQIVMLNLSVMTK